MPRKPILTRVFKSIQFKGVPFFERYPAYVVFIRYRRSPSQPFLLPFLIVEPYYLSEFSSNKIRPGQVARRQQMVFQQAVALLCVSVLKAIAGSANKIGRASCRVGV